MATSSTTMSGYVAGKIEGKVEDLMKEQKKKEKNEELKKAFGEVKEVFGLENPTLADVVAYIQTEKDMDTPSIKDMMGGLEGMKMGTGGSGTPCPCAIFPYAPWEGSTACYVAPPCSCIPTSVPVIGPCCKKVPCLGTPCFICHPSTCCFKCCTCCCDCCSCKEVGMEFCSLCHCYYKMFPGCCACCCADEKLVDGVVYLAAEAPGGGPESSEMVRS